MAFIQEQEGGDTVDLGREEDPFAAFRYDVNRTGAGFHTLINTEKMNFITDLRFRQRC